MLGSCVFGFPLDSSVLEGIVVPVPFPAVGMVVLCLPSSGLALFVVVALLIIRVGKCEWCTSVPLHWLSILVSMYWWWCG